MYYKRVPMPLEEAIAEEAGQGFECRDEFYEVMRTIADEYDTSLNEVLSIFYEHERPCV